MPAYLIACDFDGTITRRDTLHLVIDRFGRREVWDALEPDLRAGRMTLEQAMETEFATVRATPGQVRDLVRREAGIREGFPDFVRWARGVGHRVEVLSNGFASIIRDVLADAGVPDLPFHSHDAEFTLEGAHITWSARGERCTLCDRPCKRHDLAGLAHGDPVAYVGDGISDRCVAGAAAVVFARAGLAEWLTERGEPFVPYEDFHQVRAGIEARAMPREAAA